MKQLEEERETEKSKWLDFNAKVSSIVNNCIFFDFLTNFRKPPSYI